MQNFALIRRGAGTAVLEPTKIPTLPDDYVLVKTKAVALNPTDWTTLDAVGDDGTIVGLDYAGVVEDVGREAAKRFRKGDRIAGYGHGGIAHAVRSKIVMDTDNPDRKRCKPREWGVRPLYCR
jgi:NADPH:quinone reductase-like Zn-dependent oxidoreductase